MTKNYRVRALKYGNGWKSQYTRPNERHLINGNIVTAETEYPSSPEIIFNSEREANEATCEFLITEKLASLEDIDVVLNKST